MHDLTNFMWFQSWLTVKNPALKCQMRSNVRHSNVTCGEMSCSQMSVAVKCQLGSNVPWSMSLAVKRPAVKCQLRSNVPWSNVSWSQMSLVVKRQLWSNVPRSNVTCGQMSRCQMSRGQMSLVIKCHCGQMPLAVQCHVVKFPAVKCHLWSNVPCGQMSLPPSAVKCPWRFIVLWSNVPWSNVPCTLVV